MTAQQLKNSILQMAVQGKLVPQDPTDEPASVLLDRIRAEKEEMVKEGKIKKEKNPSVIFRGDDGLFYEKVGDQEPVCIEDELPFEIPESWEWARLGQIVYNHGQKKPQSEFCYIDIGSIDNQNQRLNKDETVLEAEKAPSRARKIIRQGDVIYSTVRPYLHNMCIIDKDYNHEPIASTGFAVLSCHTGLLNEYLFYYLMAPDFDSYANDISNAKGVAYPAINDDRLYKALIPVPPVNEQFRIIQKIKEVIPKVQHYNKIGHKNDQLNREFPERLKKSILQFAVQGKLVPQDPRDEPASDLIERIRVEKEQLIKSGKIKRDKHKSVIYRRGDSYYEKVDGVERCIDDEIPFDISESWEWVRLGVIASVTGGKRIPAGRRLTSSDTGHIYLRVSDMKDHSIRADGLMYVPNDIYDSISKYIIKKEDIYITVAGTIGYVGKIPPELDGANLTENADRIIFWKINQEWLIQYLCSPFIQNLILEATTKVGQPKLAIKRIENILIALPPLAEQKRIAEKINQLLTICNSLS